MRPPLGCRRVRQVQQVRQVRQLPLAFSLTPASDGRAPTGSLPSRIAHTTQSRFVLGPLWLAISGLPCCQVGSTAAAVSVAVAFHPLRVGQLPSGCNRALRSEGSRSAVWLVRLVRLIWLCCHQGFNSSQPPVPILATLRYKPNSSHTACAALQTTMFSKPHQRHARFKLRCRRVVATAASVNSASLRSMARRRANQSLELTCPGRPPWPRSSRDFAHFLLRGQVVLPRHSAQLKR